MVRKKVIIQKTGLHLRPAKKLCEMAAQFESHITIQHGDRVVNAKSVLGVLGACIKEGTELEVCCRGKDEKIALQTLMSALEEGL